MRIKKNMPPDEPDAYFTEHLPVRDLRLPQPRFVQAHVGDRPGPQTPAPTRTWPSRSKRRAIRSALCATPGCNRAAGPPSSGA